MKYRSQPRAYYVQDSTEGPNQRVKGVHDLELAEDIAALSHYWGYGIERGDRMPEIDQRTCQKTHAEAEALFSSRETLIEEVVQRTNMIKAYGQVVGNKGAAGPDGLGVEDLLDYIKEYWPRIREELLEGSYKPQGIRRVDIPKASGGVRTLGIPSVIDRLIQQAVLQVLVPIFDPGFSESSYGYRRGRSAQQSVEQARSYVESGLKWVVDIDLAGFFDTINHDVLMHRVSRKVRDKQVLRLIGNYLRSGCPEPGINKGMPQGGPLSPLLSNIILDELDKELERRGHKFCRYADDCQIYVGSRRAGERVMESVICYLEKTLKLKVNRDKSDVDRPWKRKFLGYTFLSGKRVKIRIAPESVKRLRQKLRQEFRRGRGRRIQSTIHNLNRILRGWYHYFKLSEVKSVYEELDGWIRRKLRNIIWRQWKRRWTRRKELMKRGLSEETAVRSAFNNRGPWWNSGASHMNRAFPISWFKQQGLFSFLEMYLKIC